MCAHVIMVVPKHITLKSIADVAVDVAKIGAREMKRDACYGVCVWFEGCNLVQF